MALNSKEITILNRIGTDQAYSNWFFGRAKHLKWFYPLKTKGYFLTSKIQYEGNSSLYWRTLPYLERVSEQTSQNKQYGIELINIIREFINLSVTNPNKRINNPYIWRSLIVILTNIPNDTIQQHFPIQGIDGFIKLLENCSAEDALGGLAREIGEPLLKKFLDDNSMLQYAEAIVDSITDIKPGNRKRTLSGRNDASLKWEPHWVMAAFEKNADDVGRRSEKAITIIAKKLKKAIEYNQLSSSSNIMLGDNVYEITSTRILLCSSDDNKIDFEDDAYLLDVKQYSEKQLEGKNIKEGLWELINIDPEIVILQPLRFVVSTKESFKKNILQLLPSAVNWNAFPGLDNRLSQLYENLFEDYSQVWFKSLSGGDRRHVHDAHEGLTIVLRDVLDARSKVVPNKCRNILENFLTTDYPFPLFKKFVLFFIDKYWDEGFDSLFDEFLGKVSAVLRTEAYEVELHKILRNHNATFSKELKDKIRALIEDVPNYYSEHGEKYVNYWKYKWLSPLKDNPDFSPAFVDARMNSEFKADENGYHPEETPFQAGIIHHQSVLSSEELRKRHSEGSLIAEFNKFKKADLRKAFNKEPDREGLGDVLQKAVTEDPDYFIDTIGQYVISPPFFSHRILWGLKEAYKKNKNANWSRILDFCLEYFAHNKKLLSDTNETEDGDSVRDEYLWAIGDAANLIEDGSNSNSIKHKDFSKVNDFFNLVSSIVTGEKIPDTQREVTNYALNTTLGKIILANISFGLRVSRDAKDRKHKIEERWGSSQYERYFDKGIESYIWFGYYLPHIRYLDKEYTELKLEKLSQRDATDHEWQSFMKGYLISSALYDDIYALPAIRTNYEKAIGSNDFDKKEDDSLVRHITIAYLRGNEALAATNRDGKLSLFWKMLHNIGSSERPKRWLAAAGYFWSISPRTLEKGVKEENEEPLRKEMIDRIIDFWRWTYNNRDEIEKLIQKEYHQFLARLADLTIYLDKIDDENEKWLLLVAPHCNLQHMSSFFVEYLTKFLEDDDSMKRIGNIYLRILEGTTPDFRKEHILELVNRLYQLKSKYPKTKKVADDICNVYAERDNYLLQELYIENQV